MSDSDEIERVIVEVKNLGKNSREIIYKQLRKTIDNKISKLEKIKNKIEDLNFNAPFKKRKREENKNVIKEEVVSLDDSAENLSLKYELENGGKEIKLEKEINESVVETDDEEYDPSYPNDYEKILEECKKREKEKEELKKKLKKEQYKTRMDSIIKAEEGLKINPGLKGSLKVVKMLQKMGWKGQGLGKYQQGIVTPLMAKRTNDKYGIIINANIQTKIQNEERNNANNIVYNRDPTRIIMITNMIEPNEVNCETYNEITQECEKFGFVNNVDFFIFNEEMAPGEAVRVFIEFDVKESAINAYNGLYERFYNKRLIRVNFYDESLYKSRILDSLCIR